MMSNQNEIVELWKGQNMNTHNQILGMGITSRATVRVKLKMIKTKPATGYKASDKARECIHCGRVYPGNDVPTIAEGCSDDCPQYDAINAELSAIEQTPIAGNAHHDQPLMDRIDRLVQRKDVPDEFKYRALRVLDKVMGEEPPAPGDEHAALLEYLDGCES